MKSGWTRRCPQIALDIAAVETLLAPLFPGSRVASLAPVPGGLVNTNLKVLRTDQPSPLLLRLYQGEPAHAAKEVAITARVAGTVPVAAFRYFAGSNPITGHPYAIVEWIEGETLEAVAGSLEQPGATNLGRSIGHTLAAIHSFSFDKPGFLAEDLTIAQEIDLGRNGLIAHLTRCLIEGAGGARLGAELTEAVMALAHREGELLNAWPAPPSLVHGDFNGPNVLVRPNTAGDPEVAAVVDWEFALSGSPALDFGNLLRPPLGDDADLVALIADGYRAAGGVLPADWRRIAHIADLFAWADIVCWPEAGPQVIADARRAVADIIAAGETC